MANNRQNELDTDVLRSLIAVTEPTSDEVQRLLSVRPTLDDQVGNTSLMSLADVTEPTWAEEVRLIAARQTSSRDGRTATWRRVTGPTQRELDGVSPTLPIGSVRQATAPSSFEVQRLVAHLHASPPIQSRGRRSPLAALAPALLLSAAAAVTLFTLWPSADTYGEPDIASGAVSTLLELVVVDLGPSIDLTAHPVPGRAQPRVRVAQADSDGTIVDVLQGGTHFEVDPNGLHRALTVRAGDVQVHVKGTVFTVDHIDRAVFVAVERGRVQVDTPQGSFYLTAGESWSSQQTTARANEHTAPTLDSGPTPTLALNTTSGPAPEAAIYTDSSMVLPPKETSQPAAVSARAPVEPAQLLVDDLSAPTAELVAPSALVEPASPEPSRITQLRSNMETLAGLNRRIGSGEDPERVISDVDSFLRSGPESRLVGVALELRLEAAEKSGQTEQILESISALLQHTAQHPRQVALRLRSAQLHHERGDCAEAMGDYRTVSNSSSQHASKAYIGRGLCAEELGLTDEAVLSIKAALSYPVEPDLRDTLKQKLRTLRRR